MSNKLFNEFEPVSAAQWKQKIQVDLKGADYNETLLWKTDEGITVKPFYHREDTITLGNFNTNAFSICQTIEVTNVKEANHKAIDAIARGAETVAFNIHEIISFESLLKDINTNVHFNFSFLDQEFLKSLIDFLKGFNQQYFLNIDIIGNLVKKGNWFHNLNEDHKILESLINNSPSNITIIGIQADIYQNAGANITQQLAYFLAHTNEYFNHFKENSLRSIQVRTAIGSNYFFEIAKLKAMRLLFETLKKEYTNLDTTLTIFAIPSNRNKTLYDYNVNMLRTTTECMSAILGGANTISNLPYDALYHHSNEFGDRIARNQLQILKSESYFDKVHNPTDGAYYIEEITRQLAEKALVIFKQIEQGGGFLKQLKEGTIQRKIKEAAEKEQEKFNSGELVLLGTNKHPNNEDKMKGNLEKNPFMKVEQRKTIIAPIIQKRLAESLEQKRLENE